VATMGIGTAGAKNAAGLAGRILAVKHPPLQIKLKQHAREMAEQVAAKNKALTM